MNEDYNLNQNQFSIMHLNAQSIRNKVKVLDSLIERFSELSVVCISEHWMNTNETDLYQIKNYINQSIYCRTVQEGGGVCIFVKHDVDCIELSEVKNFSVESQCEATAVLIKNIKIVIVAIYRQPKGNLNLFCSILENSLSYVTNLFQHIVLVGDFNVDLKEDNVNKSVLLNTVQSFGLKQTIFDYTRVQGDSKTIVDNIFTNLKDFNAYVPSVSISDHQTQIISLPINTKISQDKKSEYIFKRIHSKENLCNFYTHLEKQNWSEVFNCNNADKKFALFYNKFLESK